MNKLKVPPITIQIWENQLTLLIRAVRTYQPKDEGEELYRQEMLEILEGIAEVVAED